MKTVFLSLALLAMLTACEQQSSVSPTQASRQQVAYQKSVRLAGTALDLKVAQVADSRCPINARCISAGSVKVFFEATEQGTTQAIDIDLPAYPEKPVQKQFSVNGQTYVLSLSDVLPYPEAGKEVKLEDYFVQVSVSKQ